MSAAVSTVIRNQMEASLALCSTGQLEEALGVLATTGEYISDFYTLRGQIQVALRRFQEAAGSYFTVVTFEPENTVAQYQLGICLHHLKRWVEAAQAFERVLRPGPHRDYARLGLGSALLHLNRAEEAFASFDSCCSDAAREQALFGKAVALQLMGRLADAEAAYQRLLASNRNAEEVLANLIVMSMEVHNLEAVRRYSRRLLDASPKSIIAMQAMAAVALERGEYEKAVQWCSQIVDQAPGCVEAWHNLRFATGQVMSTLQRRETGPAGRG